MYRQEYVNRPLDIKRERKQDQLGILLPATNDHRQLESIIIIIDYNLERL